MSRFKSILRVLLGFALALGTFAPLTTRVFASEITLAKNVDPMTPNIYRIGDTIHYTMSVANPLANPATNTLTDIHDTLPNGSSVTLNAGNVVLAPGDSVSYTLDYVVAAGDIILLPSPPFPAGTHGVRNQLHAVGFDSLGDLIDATVNKTSTVIQPAIDLVKYVNGEDANSPTGPIVEVGSSVTFTFVVTNTGDATLAPVVVTDDVYGTIGTIPSMAPAASATLTFTTTAVVGQQTDIGTATGTPPVGPNVSDSDPANYFGESPSIDLEKLVNGEDADTPTGPIVEAGSTVTFDFIVTNTGNVTLAPVVVTDDVYGSIGTIPSLAPGASDTLTITETALAGQQTDVGTAVGTPPVGPNVTDSDPANYFGESPSIDLEKLVNGVDADTPTGPIVLVGSTVTFDFVVTNTGNVTLAPVDVTDDVYGFIGTISSMAPGDVATLTMTATALAGQRTNIGTATGTPPTGPDVSDSDPANYFGAAPAIDLEKLVNGEDADSPTGPVVPVGSMVVFEFLVTNTGNVTLAPIDVTDDVYGFIGTIPSLAPGASDFLSISTFALAGQHTNIGTATGTPPVGPDVSDSDPANYFGAAPAVDIEKLVNGEDADSPTGPVVPVGSPVTFDFIVTNTGNIELTNILVTDSVYGIIGTVPSLAPGESATMTLTVTAEAGQHTNLATVTTDQGVTDEDEGNYFGAAPAVDIEKLVNGEDADSPTGPVVPVGSPVIFDFVVTNTGNIELTNVVVTDSVYGDIGTIPSLAPGESATLTITVTAEAGQHTNLATVTTDQGVTDEDEGNYFGAAPAVDIEKLVNGEDADSPTGPVVPTGSPVIFDFIVTNTGNIELTNIVVTDSVYGDIGAIPSLAPGESATLTITVTAEAGQHTNLATVTTDQGVTDEDEGNYFGAAPAITVTKTVNMDVSKVGDEVVYTITITNSGDVDLNNITVIDTILGDLSASFADSLAPGASETVDFPYTIQAGDPDPLVNEVEVSGTDATGVTVTDTASATVDLVHPAIDVTKVANPTSAAVGDTITYTITVANTGDVELVNITVEDSLIGDLSGSFADTLAVGASESIDFTRVILATDPDPLVNTVTVHANPVGLPNDITDEDEASVAIVGMQGCTPGFWKENALKHDAVAWVGYDPDETLTDAGFVFPSELNSLADDTMIEALQYKGGNTITDAAKILLRAATAALLNASNPNVDYPLTTAEILDQVNSALASLDRDTILSLYTTLDADNNLGCPINQQGNPILPVS